MWAYNRTSRPIEKWSQARDGWLCQVFSYEYILEKESRQKHQLMGVSVTEGYLPSHKTNAK